MHQPAAPSDKPGHQPEETAAQALALLQAGRAQDAADLLQAAVKGRPGNAALTVLLGHARALTRDLDGAATAYRAALIDADGDTATWYALSLVERDRGRIDDSLDCLESVLGRDPGHVEARFDRAQILLLNGDYERGFAEYEWRLRRPAAPDRPRPQPVWQGGGDINGRHLLVYGEQGLGDTLQMVRFIPAVAAMGARVTLACHAPLVGLLRHVAGVGQAVPIGDEPGDCDLRVSVMSLPHRLGVTADTVPGAPYLPSPPDAVPDPIRQAPGRKIGIAWGGSALNGSDSRRSLPVEALRPLLGLPDVTLFSLQFDDRRQGLGQLPDGAIIDLSPHLDGFARTAAAVAGLDLVISVDTAAAHLAGGLGKPVWVLLAHMADWRWLTDREDSPWYPSARLFRQTAPGDWDGVVARVCAALTNRE